jgi:competence protein ComEC
VNPQPTTALRLRPASRQPLLWAAAAFAGGIEAGVYLWRPPVWWLAAATLFVGFASYFIGRRAWAASALGLCALFAAGSLAIQVRGPANSSGAELPRFASDQEVMVTGSITREGEVLQEGFSEARQMLDVETEQITSQGETFAVRSGLRVGFYSKGKKDESKDGKSEVPMRVFHYGERARFPSKLYAPRNFRDPGAFDYRGYLSDQGIVALGSTNANDVEVLPGFAGSRLELWRTRVRRSLVQKIQALWPADQAAIVAAMLLGEESFLGRALREDFQRSGTYHVLVVSGLKVGILALAAFWLMRRLRIGDTAASVIIILLAVCYALLSDAGTPVWRATFMLALYLFAKLLYR